MTGFTRWVSTLSSEQTAAAALRVPRRFQNDFGFIKINSNPSWPGLTRPSSLRGKLDGRLKGGHDGIRERINRNCFEA